MEDALHTSVHLHQFTIEITMPFKSEKQRRWMWANDPEMAEEWEKKEKKENNAMKITKEQIKRIIKEERAKILSEQFEKSGKGLIMELGDALDELSHWAAVTDRLMNEASRQFGELANQTTHSRRIMSETEEMANRFDEALDIIFGRME